MIDQRRSSVFPKVQDPTKLPDDGFVPEVQLEEWLRTGIAHRVGAVLRFKDGRTAGCLDAGRVLGPRSGNSDHYGITGSVLSLRALIRRGAIVGNEGFRLGAALYDLEFGCLLSYEIEQSESRCSTR